MSSFGSKRKARVIKVDDDDDNAPQITGTAPEDGNSAEESPKLVFNSRSGRKPIRQSGLRKTVNAFETSNSNGQSNDDEEDGPAVVRPNVIRANSAKQKKKQAKSSRLSFAGAGNDEADEDTEPSDVNKTKTASFGQRVLENNALKRGLTNRGLPLRSAQDDDHDRPKYSKEYLEELQSSTPNTPQNTSALPDADDAMVLDSSELDGALIVDSGDVSMSEAPQTTILTEAEIKEKKERRARLAKEQNFISLDDDEEEDRFGRKKKDDTRLVADDEEVGEGFDEFVDDGGLSLGKRAAKERRKRDRQQIAEMINAAEGHSSDSSEDSDAERRIAYEAAQTRAGMDGLKKPRKDPTSQLLQVPSKITPLPSLTECMAKLQATLQSMEDDIKKKDTRVQQLRNEKAEIAKREGEVQALLDETGKKYQEAMGTGKVNSASIPSGGATLELAGERGLESLGTTPRTVSQGADDEL